MSLPGRLVPPLSLILRAWTGNYGSVGKIGQADCLLGFSFGYRGKGTGITPGLSNQDLANTTLLHFANLPKIMQFEIAEAYCAAGAPDCKAVVRISKHRRPGKYLDTYEVACQAQELMKQHGYKRPALLAHPNHLPRAEAVCRRLGIECVVTDAMKGAVEFDPQSTQKWTRSLEQWRGYEPLAMTYYRLKDWL